MRSRRKRVLSSLAALALGLSVAPDAAAHKTVTSRYDFEADVLPILRARCGSCHVDGGPAPMPLDSHARVRPWAQAIFERVIEGEMPPWFAEPGFEALSRPRGLTAREIDVLADWVSGGAPRGGSLKAPGKNGAPAAAAALDRRPFEVMSLHLPEVALPAAGPPDVVRGTSVPLPISGGGVRHLAGWWIEPGNRALLRAATLRFRDPAGTIHAGGSWIAGAGETLFPAGSGLEVAEGSAALIELRHGKGFRLQGQEARDRPTLHLLFHRAAPEVLVIPRILPEESDAPAAGSAAWKAEWRGEWKIAAILPAGSGSAVLRGTSGAERTLLRVRGGDPAWPVLYELERPPTLGAGESLRWIGATGGPAGARATVFLLAPRGP